ncbi:HutD family protein [Herminiimonas sp. CN]|uniref:HutD/Ves family protein n=1 Tax=Herminiimonas sp. CN TaxID=1349818 RepID=UPI00047373AE|nr:HutD family protein [Herminiimonas sp. CN]
MNFRLLPQASRPLLSGCSRRRRAAPLVLTKAGQRIQPWKNGGGTTREVLRYPHGSSMDDFGWRISVATVRSAGPFSFFPGIDRSLALIEGEALLLQHPEQRSRRILTTRTPALVFSGEEPIDSCLPAGAVTDFNVMTRRQQFTHRLDRLALAGAVCIPRPGHASLLYVVRGTPCILAPHLPAAQLAPGDAVLLTAAGQPLILHAAHAEIMLVDIFPQA